MTRWQPLREAVPNGSPQGLDDNETFVRAWKNDMYTVWEFQIVGSGWTHLSIKRNDRGEVTDWRHMQQMKNEVCGPEREAVELYPATSRVLDAANQRHLWVYPEGRQFPLGAHYRNVANPETAAQFGAQQRPFEEGLTI